MTTFEIVPDRSRVWIAAQSSLHPVHGEASGLEGAIEAVVSDGRVDLSAAPTLRVRLPVEQLRSGNALQDREMARRIDARAHPHIVGEAHEVAHVDGERYHVCGELTFHGVTRRVSGDVRITFPDDATMLLSGEQVFDIRDFDVKPPKILTLKVHPAVTVRVEVLARVAG